MGCFSSVPESQTPTEVKSLLEDGDVESARRAFSEIHGKLAVDGQKLSDEAQRTLVGALEGNKSIDAIDVRCTGAWSPDVIQSLFEVLQRRDVTVRMVRLGSNGLGCAHAAALADALAANTTVKRIHIGDNRIGDRGATALAAALERNSALVELYLGANEIGVPGAAALRAAIERNTTLTYVDMSPNPCCDSAPGETLCEAIEAAVEQNKSDPIAAAKRSAQHVQPAVTSDQQAAVQQNAI